MLELDLQLVILLEKIRRCGLVGGVSHGGRGSVDGVGLEVLKGNAFSALSDLYLCIKMKISYCFSTMSACVPAAMLPTVMAMGSNSLKLSLK